MSASRPCPKPQGDLRHRRGARTGGAADIAGVVAGGSAGVVGGVVDACAVSPGETTIGAACPSPRGTRPSRPPRAPAPTRRRRAPGTAARGGGWPPGPEPRSAPPGRAAGPRCGWRVRPGLPGGDGPRPARAGGHCVRRRAPGRARGAAVPVRLAEPPSSRREPCPCGSRLPGHRRPSLLVGGVRGSGGVEAEPGGEQVFHGDEPAAVVVEHGPGQLAGLPAAPDRRTAHAARGGGFALGQQRASGAHDSVSCPAAILGSRPTHSHRPASTRRSARQ